MITENQRHTTTPHEEKPRTPVDKYIDALINDTASGTLRWYRDMSHETSPAYFFNVGKHKVYLSCIWKTPDRDRYKLQMEKPDGFQPALISEESCVTEHYSALRELWDAVSDNAVDTDEFDVIAYIYRYIFDAHKRRSAEDFYERMLQVRRELLAVLQRFQL